MVKVHDGASFNFTCCIATSPPKPYLHSLEDSLAIKQFEATAVL